MSSARAIVFASADSAASMSSRDGSMGGRAVGAYLAEGRLPGSTAELRAPEPRPSVVRGYAPSLGGRGATDYLVKRLRRRSASWRACPLTGHAQWSVVQSIIRRGKRTRAGQPTMRAVVGASV
jgi:hypothetical protein